MARDADAYLRDILESIGVIQEYNAKGRRHFETTRLVRDATAARLMHIGQAVKDAQSAGAKLDERAPGIRWRDIAGMRDRLAHRDWDMNHEIVWLVIERELPKLKDGIDGLLAGNGEAKRADRH